MSQKNRNPRWITTCRKRKDKKGGGCVSKGSEKRDGVLWGHRSHPSVHKVGLELKGTRVEQNFLQKSLCILPFDMGYGLPGAWRFGVWAWGQQRRCVRQRASLQWCEEYLAPVAAVNPSSLAETIPGLGDHSLSSYWVSRASENAGQTTAIGIHWLRSSPVLGGGIHQLQRGPSRAPFPTLKEMSTTPRKCRAFSVDKHYLSVTEGRKRIQAKVVLEE